MLSARVTATQFVHAFENPKIPQLLDKLGVHLLDPSCYVEALDANEDGMLTIGELVKGLLKLRGQVEKADTIATLMVARDMQKSLRQVEAILVKGRLQEARGPAQGARA